MKPKTLGAYFASLEGEAKRKLTEMRKILRAAAPEAEEVISYGVPAMRWNGMLVWYAAHSAHIALYPRASAIARFSDQLEGYEISKGTIRFPLSARLPARLLKQIIAFRLEENAMRPLAKKKKRSAK